MVDPLDIFWKKIPQNKDSEILENEAKRVRDGSMLAFKVEFDISQSEEIERIGESRATNV